MAVFSPDDGGGDGDTTDPGSRADIAGAGGDPAVHVDDRSAGADDLFLDAALQPARSGIGEFRRAGEFSVLSYRSGLSRVAEKHPGAGRLGARHHHCARHSLRAAAGPAGDRPQHREADGDRAVLRDADGQRAGLEESADAPGFRAVRLDRQPVRSARDRLVHRCADAGRHPDRGLAVAAVRDIDPAHRAAVAG